MIRRALVLAALLVALSGVALAQAPAGAHPIEAGPATILHHVGPTATELDEDLAQGERGEIWLTLPSNASRRVVFLNVTPSSTALAIPNGTVVLDAAANASAIANVSFATTLADAGVLNVSYDLRGEVYEEQNGTLVLVAPFTGTGSFRIDVGALVPAPGPTTVPTSWIVAGAAVLVVGGGALAYGMRQRAVRRRMNEGPRRSQVMRELELEKKLEKAKAPEQVAEIKQEIRAAEVVREKRRELQILEAKRADALKTLDLLRQRHEKGGLTKLQYDNMAAKKQADLERIEAEIAEMERQDGSAAA